MRVWGRGKAHLKKVQCRELEPGREKRKGKKEAVRENESNKRIRLLEREKLRMRW